MPVGYLRLAFIQRLAAAHDEGDTLPALVVDVEACTRESGCAGVLGDGGVIKVALLGVLIAWDIAGNVLAKDHVGQLQGACTLENLIVSWPRVRAHGKENRGFVSA